MKIRTLLGWMACAILLPVTLFSAISLKKLAASERELILSSMEESVRATSLSTDAQLREIVGLLGTLAQSNKLETGDLAGFGRKARALIGGRSAYIMLFDANGQQLVNTMLDPKDPLPSTVNEAGARVQRLLRDGHYEVSNLIMGTVMRRHVVAIEYPVRFGDGTSYVIGYGFDAAQLNQLLPRGPLAEGVHHTIFDREWNVIASTDPSRAVSGSRAPVALSQAMRDGDHELVEMGGGNGDARTYAKVTTSPLSGWSVATEVVATRLDVVSRETALFTGIGLLLALTSAIAAAAYFNRKIGKAIESVTGSAALLGRGEPMNAKPCNIAELDHLQRDLGVAATLLSRAALEREQLLETSRQAQTLAEAENRAKDEFLAMLGHELRNPMAPISTAAQILRMVNTTDPRIVQAREVIARQVEHMNRLLGDLLDVSRVTRGLVALQRETIDLANVFSGAVEQARALIDSHHHVLHVDIAPGTIWIDGDRTRLIQVLANLLINAAKYSPEYSTIELSARHEGANAIIEVSDNGPGIDAELLPRLFLPFSQGRRSADRAAGGLGLGLSLVKAVVDLHGGTVTVSQNGARGSRFIIQLACMQQMAEREAV
jgi:signal transduction histidine kinase